MKTEKFIKDYALIIYFILTIFIIIWSFIKKSTPNNANKFIRLVNLFWLMPLKFYIIFNVIIAIIQLFVNVFHIIYIKDKNKDFPAAFLFFLNYGILFILILYSLFPDYLWIILIIYIIIGPFIGLISYDNNKQSFFPYKMTDYGKKTFGSFDELKDSSSHFEKIFFIFIIIFDICLFLFFIFFIGIMIIPMSYFVVFVYTLQIPDISSKYLDTFSKLRPFVV